MKRQIDVLADETFDLCIIGGGITGAGAALDAASRGWRVALIDRADFASGTSSASSKLIHGGLRYLEYGQFSLVREALRERGRLLRNAPHLVEPVPFLIPFRLGERIGPWTWRLGLTLYDLLAGRNNIARSRRLSVRSIRTSYPGLRSDNLIGGAVYYDALMDDARLCLAVLQTAALHGAVLANYVEAESFEWRGGKIVGVAAHDCLSGRRLKIRATIVLNAAGPHADAVCAFTGGSGPPRLQPTKGVHLIAPSRGHRAAALLLHPRDGRVFFVIPWHGKTLIGTTDTAVEPCEYPNSVHDTEIDYLLEGYNHHFEPGLSVADIMGSFAGLRPLIRSTPAEPSTRSREFRLQVSDSGLVTALGGKYTTYRQSAETTCDLIATRLGRKRRTRTCSMPLIGTPKTPWCDFSRASIATLCSQFPIDGNIGTHLVRRYGDQVRVVLERIHRVPHGFARVHPDEPDLVGEQAWQRDEEMAIHDSDCFLRRSRIGLWRPELLNSVPVARRVESA